MSNFESVFTYMKDASSNLAHERIFNTTLLKNEGSVELKDLVSSEWAALKTTEKNILSGMSCPMKFTRKGMVKDGINMDVTAVGRGATKVGQTELVHSAHKKLTFDSDTAWVLAARKAKLVYSQRDSPDLASDSGLLSRITSSCANLSSVEMRSITITHALERITQKPDMKHMMMKMYLMLMDLTLAATSKSEYRRIARRMPKHLATNVDDNRRLGAVMAHQVVVDADMLTNDEVELLALSAMQYPSVKFCEDNVYNTIHMMEDDVRILSSNSRSHISKIEWVPDSLHRTIVSLACKLDVVDDWFEVVSIMRGRPHLMREVIRRTSDRTVKMDVCLSNSHNTAFGTGGRIRAIPKNFPGYLSTSVSLIADALLGHSMHASTSCMIEKLGGYGELMCQGNPATDSMYQSILREYGITTMSIETNALLMCWCQVMETHKFGWSMPIGWKEYVVSLTSEMKAGDDVEIPQVLFDCAYIMADDSAWGITRGWRGVGNCTISDIANDRNLRDENIKQTAAFLWQMGVRKTRPKVYSNTMKVGEDSLSGAEYKFLSGSEGHYQMTWLRYTIADGLGGRVDRTEEEATGLVDTYFRGVRCSVMYSETDHWVVRTLKGPELPGVSESMGITEEGIFVPPKVDSSKDGEDMIAPVSYGGEKITKHKNVFKKLTAVYKPSDIRLREAKDKGNSAKPEKDKVLSYDVVKVPGDGSCGVHAIVEGMHANGMMTTFDKERVFKAVSNRLDEKSFHEASDLARVVMEMGCGLRVIDTSSRVVHEFASDEDVVINLVRDGMHFDAATIKEEGGAYQMVVAGVNRGYASSAEGLAGLDEVRKVMPGMTSRDTSAEY
ncbi:Hv145SV-protein 3 [Helminthosporium victoriae virus 145S]|uniref:Hv145SV-protein 3 n=1 Tax=Helminthosporium victoriae virus 145S TaxID=2560520 RepID=Q8JVB5_9VIRU|nr:Hv145SV-protein 3 [Helminthosporium victoriae virus 145S]AAM68955.1 Hv145SV-protein 3 [Helminthosporium victoriae virus 145S]